MTSYLLHAREVPCGSPNDPATGLISKGLEVGLGCPSGAGALCSSTNCVTALWALSYFVLRNAGFRNTSEHVFYSCVGLPDNAHFPTVVQDQIGNNMRSRVGLAGSGRSLNSNVRVLLRLKACRDCFPHFVFALGANKFRTTRSNAAHDVCGRIRGEPGVGIKNFLSHFLDRLHETTGRRGAARTHCERGHKICRRISFAVLLDDVMAFTEDFNNLSVRGATISGVFAWFELNRVFWINQENTIVRRQGCTWASNPSNFECAFPGTIFFELTPLLRYVALVDHAHIFRVLPVGDGFLQSCKVIPPKGLVFPAVVVNCCSSESYSNFIVTSLVSLGINLFDKVVIERVRRNVDLVHGGIFNGGWQNPKLFGFCKEPLVQLKSRDAVVLVVVLDVFE